MTKEKISVCMATYNGARFITRQLESILVQLRIDDEVIIVDDCSSDETVEMIQQLSDERVRVIVQPTNSGVIASFEQALNDATGDIIFLADQDDVWGADKVVRMLQVFRDNPEVDLVHHDARVVDGNGQILAESWLASRNVAKNWSILQTIYKNAFTGCMMAFRRTLLTRALPFPKRIEMHDQWLGLVALQQNNASVYVLRLPLIDYVRHGNNATGHKRSVWQQVLGRLNMVKAMLLKKKLEGNQN